MSLAALFFAAVLVPATPGPAHPLPNPAACADYAVPGKPITACDEAIRAERDAEAKSVLLFRRGYLKVATGDFQMLADAKRDLDEAIELFAGNYQALHERAFVLTELAEPRKAIEDLTAELELWPDRPEGLRERAYARFQIGDLPGALDDWSRVVAVQKDDAFDALYLAAAYRWLGRFDEALTEADRAAQLAVRKNDQQTMQNVERFKSDTALWSRWTTAEEATAACKMPEAKETPSPSLIGQCTFVFLTGTTKSQRADALSARAMIQFLLQQDPRAALDDMRLAYALDPTASRNAINLAGILLGLNRIGEGLIYLDRAVASDPSPTTHMIRGQARLRASDCDGALADAQQSHRMEKTALSLMLLGDISTICKKDADEARKYWLEAYRMGAPEEDMRPRFAEIGVGWPPE